MNAIILLLGLLGAGAPLTHVVVPERDDPASCLANETLASVLRLTPGLRVLRIRPEPNETLAQLEHRTQARLVVDGRHEAGGLRPHTTLELHVRGRASERRTLYGSVPGLLETMWPRDLPKPPRVPAFAAANQEALRAACAGDVEAALSHSGLALGDAVRRRLARLPPPAPAPRAPVTRNGAKRAPGVLERWLEASRFAARGEFKRAFPLLSAVDKELGVGVSAPTWRRTPEPELSLHAAEVHGEFAFLFGRDRLRVLELSSGQTRLELSIAKLEPSAVLLSPTRALAFAEDRVFELDLQAPAKIRREIALEGAHPEVALTDQELMLAGRYEVVAVSRAKDVELWRQEFTDTLVAGPVFLGDRLIVPADARLLLIARETGKTQETVDLPDELAGPLHLAPSGLYMPLGGDAVARLTYNGGPNLVLWQRELFGASWPPVTFEDTVALAMQAPRRPPLVGALSGTDRPFLRVLERAASAPLAPLPGGGLVFADARRTTLTGKDAKGRIVLRARAAQPFRHVSSAAQHVFAEAGSQILVLEGARGEIEQRIELGAVPLAAALSEDGGVALLPDGTVYGLPPIQDLRMRAFKRDVRRELAEAAAASGRAPLAKKLAEELLEEEPDDLDALAIAARATPRDGSASQWYRVLERAPASDPLHDLAMAELQKASGLLSRTSLDAPIRRVHAPSPDRLLVELERELVARAPSAPTAPLWSAPKQEVASVGGVLRIDDALYDPRSGQRLGALRGRRPLDAPGLFFLSAEAEPTLSLEAPDGTVIFSQRFEERGLRVLDSSSEFAVVASEGDAGTVHVLSTTDGTRLWMRPFDERVEDAHLFEGTLLLRTPTRLIGVDAGAGKLAFETALPKNEPVTHGLRAASGLVLVSAKRLTLYDAKRGRATRVLPLSRPITRLAWADPILFASLEDESLTAFDLARGRRGGRLELPAPEQLFISDGLLGVVEAGGAAFVLFEAARLLLP